MLFVALNVFDDVLYGANLKELFVACYVFGAVLYGYRKVTYKPQSYHMTNL